MIECTLHKKLHAADGPMQMNVSFTAEEGEFISIYGASGAGKTSILRMLAGFLEPDDGVVQFNNETWFNSNKKIRVPPQKRKTGFVFQDYALFPNMSVKENLHFALQKGEPGNVIDELMLLTALEQLYNRRVQTLSGGQKQRVALARALVRKPELLLLDEPLSAIDDEMRLKLQNILMHIHRRYNLITILVSHDVSEIIKLCDKTIVLENGLIKKCGQPAEIFFPRQQTGNFFINGQLTDIKQEGNIYSLTILAGAQIIEMPATENEIKNLHRGDKVRLTSDTFKPEIKKYTE